MNTEIQEKIINLMLKNKTARLAIAISSHYWFFHFYFHQYIKYPTAEFQKEMLHLTECDDIPNLILAGFRGSAKSSIITMSYVIWAILGRQKKKFIVIISKTEEKTRQHLLNLKKELEENSLLKQDLGPFQAEHDKLGNVKALILSSYGAKIAAKSAGQSVRGIRHNQYRPDVIILDDVEDTESIRNQEERDKAYEWLTNDVLPAGDLGTRIIFVGTPLHQDSLLMTLKRYIEEGKVNGIFKEYPFSNEQNQPLWPGKFSSEEIIKNFRKTIPSEVAWKREYLLETVSEEDQVVRKEWLNYYDSLPPELESSYRYTIIAIDPAISQKESAACTAMVIGSVYGYNERMRIYIHPLSINERLSVQEIKERAELLSKSFGRGSRAQIIVEDVGVQGYLSQDLANAGYPAIPVRIQGDKRARLMVAAAPIQGGKVLFPKFGAEKLIQQIMWFDQNKYKDLADAFSLLVNYVMQSSLNMPAGCVPLFSADELKIGPLPESQNLMGMPKVGIVVRGGIRKRTVVVARFENSAKVLLNSESDDISAIIDLVTDFLRHPWSPFDDYSVFPEKMYNGIMLCDQLNRIYPRESFGVNFSASPEYNEREYYNLKAQSYDRLRRWIKERQPTLDEEIFTGLLNQYWQIREDGKMEILAYEEMQKRGLLCSDIADALALTFSTSATRPPPYKPPPIPTLGDYGLF